MPSKTLLEQFRAMHAQHQERLYEESRKGLTIQERRKADQLEQALKPKQTFADTLEKARLILPQIVNDKAYGDQKRINVAEMRRLLNIPHNMAYNIRSELLKELHTKEANAEAQQGSGEAAED
jgi:hypothetical protein